MAKKRRRTAPSAAAVGTTSGTNEGASSSAPASKSESAVAVLVPDAGLEAELKELDAYWASLTKEEERKLSGDTTTRGDDAGAGSEAAYLARQMEAFGQELAALRDDEAFDAQSIPRLAEFLTAGRAN